MDSLRTRERTARLKTRKSLTEKETGKLAGLLLRQLDRVEKYAGLVQQQEKLIEEEDYQKLERILGKKSKILSSMEEIATIPLLAEQEARKGGKDAVLAQKLLSQLISRLDFFSGREKTCINKALEIKEKLSGQLRQLRKGKKLLREYKRSPRDPKARFKDIKT
jgi:hypothetical protein